MNGIVSLENERKRKLDSMVGIRLPQYIRDKAKKIAAENSDEKTSVKEAAVYRSIIMDVLDPEAAEK